MSKTRKNKIKRKHKKKICCVGIGCPEWKHCIHVLGDGDKYRPKRKSTLKRMKKCLTHYAKTYKKCMRRERKKSQKQRKKAQKRKKTVESYIKDKIYGDYPAYLKNVK